MTQFHSNAQRRPVSPELLETERVCAFPFLIKKKKIKKKKNPLFGSRLWKKIVLAQEDVLRKGQSLSWKGKIKEKKAKGHTNMDFPGEWYFLQINCSLNKILLQKRMKNPHRYMSYKVKWIWNISLVHICSHSNIQTFLVMMADASV